MKRLGIALALLGALGGCSMFGGGKENKPKTAVLGDRIPVLAAETAVEVDPNLADTPVMLPAPAANASWTQPGGNAAKSMGHLMLGKTLSRAWSVKIAGSSKKARLAASPVVADGKLFAIDTNATIHAFNAKTGASLWETRLSGADKDRKALFGGGVSYDNGRLYATNGLGDAAALDATTGAVIWKTRPGGPLRGAPTIAYDQVYVVAEDNQIFALKVESGEVVWNEAGTLETSGVFGVAAPAVGQGTVIAGFSSGELNAYRYENGRLVWGDALSPTSISTSVSSLSDIDADPVVDQGQVYAIGQGGRMVALELVTGQRLWELNIAGIKTPWVAGDWVFVVTDDARVLCIARATGKIRWMTKLKHWKNEKKRTGETTWTGPLLAGGRLLLVSSKGEQVDIAPDDGKVLSTRKLDNEVHLSPVIADSMLYILDAAGRITAWR
ncbi:MAG TPA: PQQ-binding-like beta-propeller repeat protein [Sphingomonadaceae bacterium]|nr:PQQ-binding-like beta-propeller repeat protein [Sphingomonadaceae bacterium]